MTKTAFLWGLLFLLFPTLALSQTRTTWMADNGNGTYTNPLFYDEFSDPDVIRVGSDFYLAGTTMHCVPGVVVLHSRDLVNWDLASYCFDRFSDLPEFNLNQGREAYGQGIWAPCIRYHDGQFYVFSNINGHGLQVYIARDAKGPWRHIDMGGNIYDLSVLFDDDGKIYAIHGYDEVKAIEMKPDFSGFVEGSERVIIPRGNAMGEGHHIYKINGKYYIISADYSPMGRMQCARADRIDGPYETVTISAEETLGTSVVHTVNNVGLGSPVPADGFNYSISAHQPANMGCATLHQGGIVDLPNGEWWGISMQDFRAVGRTLDLSPVTWVDGWPYFGLKGNLGRTPRTWFKPQVRTQEQPHAPYVRNDNFNGPRLQRVWQWNHNPVEKHWRLAKGRLQLDALPANSFLWAHNTLTQRVIGPVSVATVELYSNKLKAGDVAGLALLNMPYSYIGVTKTPKGLTLKQYDQNGNRTAEADVKVGNRVFLRCEFHTDVDSAQMSYSLDGQQFVPLGQRMVTPYQLKTFQGSRYSLFCFNSLGKQGGTAQFDNFTVKEPLADRSANLPVGKVVVLQNLADSQLMWANPHGPVHFVGKGNTKEYEGPGCRFRVVDRGQGRVALEALNGTGYVSVLGTGMSGDVRMVKDLTDASLFVWQDMLQGQCMLLSLSTHRYLGIHPGWGSPYSADLAGSSADRLNGAVFAWKVVADR